MTYPSSAASGMSKREYFASLALMGIVGSDRFKTGDYDPGGWAAKTAVEYADALIKALNEE